MRNLFQVKFWTHLRTSSMMTVVTVRTRPRYFYIVFIVRFNANWKNNFRWNPQSIWKGHAWLCHQPGKQQDRFHCSTSGVVSHWNHPIFAPWRHHGSLAHVQTFSQSKLPGLFKFWHKKCVFTSCIFISFQLCNSNMLWSELYQDHLMMPISSELRLLAEGYGWKKLFFTNKLQLQVITIHRHGKAILRKT